MARLARVEVVDCPHHITQRGNRKLQTFYSDADYRTYIKLLAESKAKADVSVWAYCLMPNHVHLVAVPSSSGGLAKLVQHPHRRYAWRINRRMNWHGHLWQSRFYSCPMDERHLMAAVRYVEMNPVRAGLCSHPREWKWSSVHAHLEQKDDALVEVKPMLDRAGDWKRYLGETALPAMIAAIRESSASGRPAGDDDFVRSVEAETGRRLRKRLPGPAPVRLRN